MAEDRAMNGPEQRVGMLAAADLGALAAFRAHNGWMLRACEDGGFWLRVPANDEEAFRKLPLLGRWIELDGGKIVREVRRVPEAVLPPDGWQNLATLLPVTPPPRGAPGMPPAAQSFRLVPDDEMRPAGALLCRWQDFATWAETCFAPRLKPLRFACSGDERAFIRGEPLPAIPGHGFHSQGRLWLPCGYRLPDHVWPGLLEELLRLGSNRLAIVQADGTHEEMDEENLIPANRAAIRASGVREITPF